MNKIPLHWATKEHDLVANALGYNVHNTQMRKHSEPYFDYREDAEVALTIAPGDLYKPVPGKFNILFTMWELLDVPPKYIENFANADAIIVPARFCKDIFSRYFPKDKIWVCAEGVDPDVFTFKERKFPSLEVDEKGNHKERFRFLWVGAPNERKGYRFMTELVRIFEQLPNTEVYLKTTMPKLDWKGTIENTWKNRAQIFRKDGKGLAALKRMVNRIPKPYMNERLTVFGKHKNIFLDTRKLPIGELIELYHSAHAFVLPHLGEGWGLTLCEAMATGAPCISVSETGCKDFFDESVGYCLKTIILEQNLKGNYDLDKARAYVPVAQDVLEKMSQVMVDYDRALKLGRAASNRIRTKFTWPIAGRRLRQVVDEIIAQKENNKCKTSSRPAGIISI